MRRTRPLLLGTFAVLAVGAFTAWRWRHHRDWTCIATARSGTAWLMAQDDDGHGGLRFRSVKLDWEADGGAKADYGGPTDVNPVALEAGRARSLAVRMLEPLALPAAPSPHQAMIEIALSCDGRFVSRSLLSPELGGIYHYSLSDCREGGAMNEEFHGRFACARGWVSQQLRGAERDERAGTVAAMVDQVTAELKTEPVVKSSHYR